MKVLKKLEKARKKIKPKIKDKPNRKRIRTKALTMVLAATPGTKLVTLNRQLVDMYKYTLAAETELNDIVQVVRDDLDTVFSDDERPMKDDVDLYSLFELRRAQSAFLDIRARTKIE